MSQKQITRPYSTSKTYKKQHISQRKLIERQELLKRIEKEAEQKEQLAMAERNEFYRQSTLKLKRRRYINSFEFLSNLRIEDKVIVYCYSNNQKLNQTREKLQMLENMYAESILMTEQYYNDNFYSLLDELGESYIEMCNDMYDMAIGAPDMGEPDMGAPDMAMGGPGHGMEAGGRKLSNHKQSKLILSNFKQIGGHSDDGRINNLMIELENCIADSVHDFKPSLQERNFCWPTERYGSSDRESYDKFLKKINEINPNACSVLKPYYERESNFEEAIKVDFFMGELAGDIENVNYYFTTSSIPTSWSLARQNFFKTRDPYISLDKLAEDLKNYGAEYEMLDAVMSRSAMEKVLGRRIYTLATLWDPAPSSPPLKDLFEIITNGQTLRNNAFQLVMEGTINEYHIYDWQVNANGNVFSLYDTTYARLFNLVGIQLRLAIPIAAHSDGTFNLGAGHKGKVCVRITIGSAAQYFVLSSGGFSVSALSMALTYLESARPPFWSTTNTLTIPGLTTAETLNPELQSIIDYLRTPGLSPIQIQAILFMFKKSGDQGQTTLNKILNELGIMSALTTGDALCLVHSFIVKIGYSSYGGLTLGKYYGGKGNDKDENNHYLVAHYPTGNNPVKIKNRIKELCQQIFQLESKLEPKSEPDVPAEMMAEMMGDMMARNEDLSSLFNAFDSALNDARVDSIVATIRGIGQTINDIKETLIDRFNETPIFAHIYKLSFMPDEFVNGDIDRMKALISELIKFSDNLYLLYNYTNLIQLYIDNCLKKEEEILSEIAIVPSIILSSSSSSSGQEVRFTRGKEQFGRIAGAFKSFLYKLSKSPTLKPADQISSDEGAVLKIISTRRKFLDTKEVFKAFVREKMPRLLEQGRDIIERIHEAFQAKMIEQINKVVGGDILIGLLTQPVELKRMDEAREQDIAHAKQERIRILLEKEEAKRQAKEVLKAERMSAKLSSKSFKKTMFSKLASASAAATGALKRAISTASSVAASAASAMRVGGGKRISKKKNRKYSRKPAIRTNRKSHKKRL
jgi:hypothetical protein